MSCGGPEVNGAGQRQHTAATSGPLRPGEDRSGQLGLVSCRFQEIKLLRLGTWTLNNICSIIRPVSDGPDDDE